MAEDIYGQTTVDRVVSLESLEFSSEQFQVANELKPADCRRILADLTKQGALARVEGGTRFCVSDTRLRVLIDPEEALLTGATDGRDQD